MPQRRTTDDRVISLVQDNAASLLRIAQRHSLCPDDAQDAYQRSLEIYLERIDRVSDETAGAWLRTVCKHEAMRLRDARRRVLPSKAIAWDREPAPEASDADERVASLERVARAAEALQACKADEATAMLLRADGSSYAEIGELCGWSYTKTNRCLAEGRARFLRRFADIERGEVCKGFAPVLSAIVDGEATPDDYAALRPHLRHCAPCRATLRALYEAEPALHALVPAGALVLVAPEAGGIVTRAYEAVVTQFAPLAEAVTTTKAAAVVASTAAVAAGGAAAERVVTDRGAPPVRAAASTAAPAERAWEGAALPAATPPVARRERRAPSREAARRPAPKPARAATEFAPREFAAPASREFAAAQPPPVEARAAEAAGFESAAPGGGGARGDGGGAEFGFAG